MDILIETATSNEVQRWGSPPAKDYLAAKKIVREAKPEVPE